MRWTVTGLVGGDELGEFQPQRSARVRCPYDLAGGLLDTTSSDQHSLRLRMFATRGPKGDVGASPPCKQSSRAGRLLTVQTREEPSSSCDGDYALPERLADVTTDGRATTTHGLTVSLAPGAVGRCRSLGGVSHVCCKVSGLTGMHGRNAYAMSI